LEENRQENWIDVHKLRIITYGADLHIDCHLTLPWYLDTRSSHAEVKAFEHLIDRHTEREVEFFIHADPCEPPQNCRICTKQNCPVRQATCEQPGIWTISSLMNPLPLHRHPAD
jgi:divalent metal cation (Fe/Co/Zn/Cd) transporter